MVRWSYHTEGTSVLQEARQASCQVVQQIPSAKLRADAIRNRERLLKAAADIFSAGGPDASLEAVAKRAGVGIQRNALSSFSNARSPVRGGISA